MDFEEINLTFFQVLLTFQVLFHFEDHQTSFGNWLNTFSPSPSKNQKETENQ